MSAARGRSTLVGVGGCAMVLGCAGINRDAHAHDAHALLLAGASSARAAAPLLVLKMSYVDTASTCRSFSAVEETPGASMHRPPAKGAAAELRWVEPVSMRCASENTKQRRHSRAAVIIARRHAACPGGSLGCRICWRSVMVARCTHGGRSPPTTTAPLQSLPDVRKML